MSALGGSGTAKAVAAELAETADNHPQKVTEDYITRIIDQRRNSAAQFAAEVHSSKYGLHPERIAALCEPCGAIDRLMSATFPAAQNGAAIRANNFRTLMLIERQAAELSAKAGMENVRLARSLQEVARLSIRDKGMMNEIEKVIDTAKANPNGEVALALDGLSLVCTGIEYAKSESPDALDAFARSIAGEGGMVDSIKNEVIANESRLLDRVLLQIAKNKTPVDLYKLRGIDISSAQSMGALVANCDEAIRRDTNADRKAALEVTRETIHAMRLMAIMESNDHYKETSLSNKLVLICSMLRAGDLRSVGARIGATTAYNIFSGIGYNAIDAAIDARVVEGNWTGEELTDKECNALARRLKIPEHILSGASASAYRTALGAVAPSKITPKSAIRKQ